ncbi:MAG: branched-chain amino acid ABC transporter permease, partial [Dehalococcoidia bacterium]|nr:branched-chain amino acid ABC transporter permease [Dehalococcoidia bacterium]
EPAIHSTWLIYIFLIVIAGGLGSIRGTVFSGLLIGLIIGLAGFVLPYVWVNLILFGLLLIVLLIKPEGLFQQ